MIEACARPLCVLLCASLLAAAGSGTAPEPHSGEGVLRVGTSGDYPPFSHAGEGFDVEVARRFAQSRGERIQWVAFRWPELGDDVAQERFDVAMSGITWRPERAVVGWLTRAVAAGGPCVVGATQPLRVAVNRGGFLEAWTREQLPQASVLATQDNLSLPERLARGEVDAFVTDRFELPHFRRTDWPVRCEPPRHRKVYWVVASRAADLGPALDAWLAAHDPDLEGLRERWLGGASRRDAEDHLVDLLARRLELMPAVARWKLRRGLRIEDPAREQRVLGAARRQAERAGLEPDAVVDLFRVQIEAAKRVQGRVARDAMGDAGRDLDLESQLRPLLVRLGARIVEALAEAVPISPESLQGERMAPLEPWLDAAERDAWVRRLCAVRRVASDRGALQLR